MVLEFIRGIRHHKPDVEGAGEIGEISRNVIGAVTLASGQIEQGKYVDNESLTQAGLEISQELCESAWGEMKADWPSQVNVDMVKYYWGVDSMREMRWEIFSNHYIAGIRKFWKQQELGEIIRAERVIRREGGGYDLPLGISKSPDSYRSPSESLRIDVRGEVPTIVVSESEKREGILNLLTKGARGNVGARVIRKPFFLGHGGSVKDGTRIIPYQSSAEDGMMNELAQEVLSRVHKGGWRRTGKYAGKEVVVLKDFAWMIEEMKEGEATSMWRVWKTLNENRTGVSVVGVVTPQEYISMASNEKGRWFLDNSRILVTKVNEPRRARAMGSAVRNDEVSKISDSEIMSVKDGKRYWLVKE